MSSVAVFSRNSAENKDSHISALLILPEKIAIHQDYSGYWLIEIYGWLWCRQKSDWLEIDRTKKLQETKQGFVK